MNAEEREILEPDDASLRHAIRNLGSRNERQVEANRALILSAGARALPVLISELEIGKTEARRRSKSIGRLSGWILVAALVSAAVLQSTWPLWAGFQATTLMSVILANLGRSSRWMRNAATTIAEFDGPDATCSMLEAYSTLWMTEHSGLRAEIVRRLSRITPEDGVWLRDKTLDRVIHMLPQTPAGRRTFVSDVLTIGRALRAVGAVRALPALKRIDTESVFLQSDRYLELTEGLEEIIMDLEAETERQKLNERLLRPASRDSERLLRSDYVHWDDDPKVLLRPVG